MRKSFALFALLFSLSACAAFQQAKEPVTPDKESKTDEGLLKHQIVAAQEQSARLEVRISQFEKEIQSLTKVLRGMEKQQKRIEGNMESLRRELIKRTAKLTPSKRDVQTSGPSKVSAEELRKKALRQSSNPAFNQPAQENGTSTESTPQNAPPKIVPQPPVSIQKSSLMKPEPRLTPREAYNRAYQSVREKKNQEAILQFRNFLRRFPKNRLAANAQYWLGESYYDMRDFPTSLEEFQKVIIRYPGSSKVPDALYKKALTYLRLKEPDKAILEFEILLKNYPRHRLAPKAQKYMASLRK